MNDLEQSISRILESYKSAVLARDAEALMRLYDPKVRVFDTWGAWEHQGAEKWQRVVEAWFASLGTDRVIVTYEDLQVVGSREMAVVTAVFSYAAVSPQGEQLRAMQNRLTWALKMSGHVLRIVHEHTSVPIGYEDTKAIFQRNPDE
ncbi:nuclear transport factor 2 family protein [soil metagenome]